MQSGAAVPQPLRPPLLGLVQWVKGDAGLDVAATRVISWADQSAAGQDFAQPTVASRPFDTGDSIDGIPCISFGAGATANKSLVTAGNFVDRTATPMTGASARTVMAVIKPSFDVAWGWTGGQIWSQSNWQALFDLESTFVPDGAYAWARAWRNPATAMAFTPITGGAGGPYDGTPTLVEYQSSGSPALTFLLNNVATTLTPSTMPGVAGGTSIATLSIDTPQSFFGAMSELLIWDYNLSTDPVAHTQAIDYIRSRYPSLPLT
jgi:hypothetical protein